MNLPRVLLPAATAAVLLTAMTACSSDTNSSPHQSRTTTPSATATGSGRTADIQLTVNGHRFHATLNGSATARDFAAQLPLTLDLRDLNEEEKVGDLPHALTTDGAPDGADPHPGDIAYYSPWGTLATYYGDAPYADGIVPIGHMADSGVSQLANADRISIEAAS
jgi:hypothetical protein